MTKEDRIFLDLLENAPKYAVDGVVLVNLADLFGGEEAVYEPIEDLLAGYWTIESRRWSGGQHTEKSVVEETSHA
jgi:hypothetical protein